MSVIKPLNLETSISTANTVGNNVLVRCVNPTAGHVVVTLASNPSTNVSSVTVLSNTAVIIEKQPTFLIQGTGILATPVAYRY